MNEITRINIKNPFNHADREISRLDYKPGGHVIDYMPEIDEQDLVVCVNGKNIARDKWETTPVKAASFVSLCPVIGKGGGGKNILGLVAGIALSVVAMGVGSLVSGGAFFGQGALAMSAWSWGGYLAALAVMWVGGMLISKMTPQPEMDIQEQSTNYSWNPSQILTGQGHAIGIIYGTIKPVPIVLAQHVSTDGEKQYLNVLLCLGDGPIDADGVKNIRINDNPIANYDNVQYDIRTGTNDQTVIPNFNDTYADQPLSYELNVASTWEDPNVATHQTDGNAAQGLEIELSFPGGLYHVNDDGGLTTANVTVAAEYKLSTASEWANFFASGLKINSTTYMGNAYAGVGPLFNIQTGPGARAEVWTITCIETENSSGNFGGVPSYAKKFMVVGSVTGRTADAIFGSRYSNEYIIFDISRSYVCMVGWSFVVTIGAYSTTLISASSSSALYRRFRVDNIPAGCYDVRLRCTAKSGTTTRDSTRVYWSQLSSILYDDFSRPGKVLIGIKALATGQLSNSVPNITCTVTRSKVWVYNPTTETYQQKDADNPAWASYDLIHRAKYLFDIQAAEYKFAVFGAPKEKIVYQDFSDWADFCDTKNLKANYFISKSTDLWSALREIEGAGRGKVILRGTRFGAICDAPGNPVHLFTMGNIIRDTFKIEFLSMKDRANALEVTFSNAAKNFERDVVTVYGDDYDTDGRVKHPTQITMDAITNLAQAFREAKYRLRLNQYLKRTVSFEAGVDSIPCQVGDVVNVQHDVPQWGYGGRIMDVDVVSIYDGETFLYINITLKLDQDITFVANTEYAIMIRIASTDVIIEKKLSEFTVDTTTDTVVLNLTEALTTDPAQYDVYSLGKLFLVAKPFRVVNITRGSDMTRRVSCLEYIAAVYNEATNIPEINYSALEPYTEIYNLNIGQETFAQKDGTILSVLYVSWGVPRNRKTLNYHVFYSSDGGNTWLKWGETNQTRISIWGVKTLYNYLIKICTLNDAGIMSPGVISNYVYVTGKDLPPPNVEILIAESDPYDKTKILLEWTAVSVLDLRGYELREGSSVVATNLTETKYIYRAAETRVYNFTLRAIDTSGNYSTVGAVDSIDISVEPSDVTGFTATANANNRTRIDLKWNALQEIDISNYEIRMGDTWDGGEVVAHIKAASFTYQLSTSGFKRFWIKAINLGGFYSVNTAGAEGQFNFASATPTGGQVAQDINDRTRLIVSWLPVADPDVNQYEVRLGLDWDTGQVVGIVNGTSVVHVISADATYNFMVRSKNVAGYYSSILNISGTYSVAVSNVSNFTGTRSITDKSKIRLTWSPVGDRDVDHYEIREGLTWESGTLIFGNIAGTFYDATTTEERTYKYWIKAISKAGKSSLSPTSFSILISMNPTAPGNLTITTDPADRTKAVITWTASPDLDVIEYELRNGISWEAGTTLIKTKELHFTWTIPESEAYSVRLKARNASNFESDEVLIAYTSYVEPSDVTGFKAMQNGENVLLTWNKISDVDVSSYELHEGPSWETSSLIATGITGTAFQFLADRETTRTFLIKAVNRAGNLSQNAALAVVTISGLPPRNVVVTYDEIDLRTGTKDGTTFGPSEFKYSTLGGKFSEYDTTKFSEIGGENVLILDRIPWTWQNLPGLWSDYPDTPFNEPGLFYATGEYITTVKDIGKIITANISTLFSSSTRKTVGTTTSLFYRTSADNSTWTDWKPYISAQTIFRYLQFKAILTTNNVDVTPEVNQFYINVDVPDVIRNGSYNVAAGGSTINFGYSFYAVPSVVPTATTLGHRATINGTPSVSNFAVKVYDANNNDVGGPIMWIARGY